MPGRLPTALYVLTQMVDDWATEGPAMIHWAARRLEKSPVPWAISAVVAGEEHLSPEERVSVEAAAQRFFTPHEVEDLGALLVEQSFGGKQSLRYGRVDLPTTAEIMLAMQDPNPFGTRKLWRIRPPDPVLAGCPVPCEGIVSLWPWPGLDPENIAPLMAMRENLGKDAFLSKHSSAER